MEAKAGPGGDGAVAVLSHLSCLFPWPHAGPSDSTVSKGKLPSVLICDDGHFRYPSAWRGAGVATPIFSLRSSRSLGCGDFADLISLIDLCHSCGMKIVQVLPVNDTSVYGTWRDSYPYACSEFARPHAASLEPCRQCSSCR